MPHRTPYNLVSLEKDEKEDEKEEDREVTGVPTVAPTEASPVVLSRKRQFGDVLSPNLDRSTLSTGSKSATGAANKRIRAKISSSAVVGGASQESVASEGQQECTQS